MKPRGPDNVVVYYVTAVISALIVLAYIAAGEVTPIVGFLVGGTLMFALYPNKTIALVVGVLISAALRQPKREGFKEGEEKPEAKPEMKIPNAEELTKALENAKKLSESKAEGAPGAAAPTTGAPVKPEENPAATATTVKPPTTKSGFVGSKELSPSELPSEGGASGPQDVEKLSQMIDKTMELLKMLPEGFLQNAVK